MSYRNKGTTGTTVIVSVDPDFSGNYVCDGTADDVQIQAALDYVETLGVGGTVLLKGGVYDITATISIPSYTILEGEWLPELAQTVSRLNLANGVNADVIDNKGAAVAVGVRYITINGNRLNQTAGNGINFDATSSIIHHNTLNACYENGIQFTGQLTRATENRGQNSNDDFIAAGGADSWVLYNDGASSAEGCHVTAGNMLIEGNNFFQCGARGIFLDDAGDYCTVANNRCNDNTTQGIQVQGRYCVISDNRCIDNTQNGIYIHSQDAVVDGNHCLSNDQSGIFVTTNGDRCAVTSNVCYENGRHGISAYDITYNTITGNTCMSNGQAGAFYGIFLDWVSGVCGYNTIADNICSDDDGSPTQDYGIYLDANAGVIENIVTGNVCRGNTVYGIYVGAGALRNVVKDNTLTGNTTGGITDLGDDTAVHEELVYVTDPDGNVGDHPALVLPDQTDTTFRFQVHVPLEFQETVTAQAIVVQTVTAAGPPDMQWSTTTDWGKLCAAENYNAGSDAETDQTTAVAQNNLVCIDVSASLTGIAAGDLVGFTFIRRASQAGDTINADAYYLGFRLRYV